MDTRPPRDTAIAFDAQRQAGARFAFGRNWSRFLTELDDERIRIAERSLSALVETPLADRSFLDIGSGSGLFSLAAMRLGARRVHSFDFDPDSVRCTESLRQRFLAADSRWTIDRASILDDGYVAALGAWDVVYSWGVLHHTGQLWIALENAARCVAPSGTLAVAIYNDQGPVSAGWRRVKRVYNHGLLARAAVCAAFFPYFAATGMAADVLRGRNPITRYRSAGAIRGMSPVRDWHDWLGGLPFEVATPEAVFDFVRGRGFSLARLRTCGGRMGCNEFVFRRDASRPAEGRAAAR